MQAKCLYLFCAGPESVVVTVYPSVKSVLRSECSNFVMVHLLSMSSSLWLSVLGALNGYWDSVMTLQQASDVAVARIACTATAFPVEIRYVRSH